ncbi:Uncharacterised protein [Mycobacteroides abscessus subsp. abscessus]|nr:Uncharacterised protein [Mycobacteroides abscessus subsp. abscessus]
MVDAQTCAMLSTSGPGLWAGPSAYGEKPAPNRAPWPR